MSLEVNGFGKAFNLVGYGDGSADLRDPGSGRRAALIVVLPDPSKVASWKRSASSTTRRSPGPARADGGPAVSMRWPRPGFRGEERPGWQFPLFNRSTSVSKQPPPAPVVGSSAAVAASATRRAFRGRLKCRNRPARKSSISPVSRTTGIRSWKACTVALGSVVIIEKRGRARRTPPRSRRSTSRLRRPGEEIGALQPLRAGELVIARRRHEAAPFLEGLTPHRAVELVLARVVHRSQARTLETPAHRHQVRSACIDGARSVRRTSLSRTGPGADLPEGRKVWSGCRVRLVRRLHMA